MRNSKRSICLLLVVLLVVAVAAPAIAETSAVGCGSNNDFTWLERSDGTIAIARYKGTDANVNIGSQISGKTISSIGLTSQEWNDELGQWDATSEEFFYEQLFGDNSFTPRDVFDNCARVENVSIPETTVTIGDYAFAGCENLTSIDLPQTVASIGKNAFNGCRQLSAVTLPQGLTVLGESSFQGCKALTSITIPAGVADVGAEAFLGCDRLTTVQFSSADTRLGDGAFSGCEALNAINLPENLTSIPKNAFKGCSSIGGTEENPLQIPIAVRTIGKEALYGTGAWIFFDADENTVIGERDPSVEVNADAPLYIAPDAFSGCKGVTVRFDGTVEKCEQWQTYAVGALQGLPEGSVKVNLTTGVEPTPKPSSSPSQEPPSTISRVPSSEASSSTTSERPSSAQPSSTTSETSAVDGMASTVPETSASTIPSTVPTIVVSQRPWVPAASAAPESNASAEPSPEVCPYCGNTGHDIEDCPYNTTAQPAVSEPVLPVPPAVVQPVAAATPNPSPVASSNASSEPEESEEPSPSTFDLSAQEPIDVENAEVWEVVPPANARRLNGQFAFEARGNDVDIEKARESVRSWATQNFGDDVTVTFRSETEAANARAVQPTTLRTGDEVYIETPDGTRCSYDIAIRGDVSPGVNENGEPVENDSLTQLLHIVSVMIAEMQNEAAQVSESEAVAEPAGTPEVDASPEPEEMTLTASQMSRAGTRPAPKPTASKSSVSVAQKAAADVDGSGKVTITDAVQHAQYMNEPHPDGPVYPDGPKQTAWESDNKGLQGYMNSRRWARLSSSYLMTNNKGGVSRVEYVGDAVLIEDYDADLNLVMSRQLPMELEKWGGFYSGKNYNYVIYGQENDEESTTKEVVRVVQYSKDWKRIDADSMYGANTSSPFLAGALRCAEHKGYVYIRTCHNMFTGKEGIRHQANMLIVVREKDMKITDSESEVVWGTGLVSHSFNQFVLVDKDGKLVGLDHGDGNPRALALRRYLKPAGEDKIVVGDGQSMEVEVADIQEIVGDIGDNDTGCSLGGFEEVQNGYVAAYGYDGKGERREPRNIHFSFTSRDLKKTVKTQLTSGEDVQVPMLVSTGLDGGYIMWAGAPDKDRNRTLNYARYDKNGKVGKTQTSDAPMSDCQPIIWKGKILWYVTDESGPVFCSLPVD